MLATVLPLSLAAGVSPMMLSEQLVLLGSRGGRRSADAYAAGTATIVLGLLVAILAIGANLELPAAPHLSARLDIAVGVVLLVLALLLARRRPAVTAKPGTAPTDRGVSSSYLFGLFAMATNVTTLPIVLAAGKDVVAHGDGAAAVVLGSCVILAGACAPAWVPLVLSRLPGGQAALERVSRLIATDGRRILVLATTSAGVFCLVKGVLQLL